MGYRRKMALRGKNGTPVINESHENQPHVGNHQLAHNVRASQTTRTVSWLQGLLAFGMFPFEEGALDVSATLDTLPRIRQE